MRALTWLRKGGGDDRKFVKGQPTEQGKKARDEFFALKKEKRPAKRLTPLQRRMQSGHA